MRQEMNIGENTQNQQVTAVIYHYDKLGLKT